ncbi:GtrA family protein [Portibacter lacus]|uniref:GtrA family protein n=1 Tax=Portibacter lacus TaxID=1099794 RepID=UPI00374CA7AC
MGAVVTSLSLSTNFVLLKYFETPLFLTYICVYAFSIMLSFLLNSTFTFKTVIKVKNMITYYSIYITGLILGVLIMKLFTHFLSFENYIYPFLVLPFTTIWNFTIANRFLSKT